MARTLVIGGTLFIGRALVRRLLDRGDDVTILHRGSHNPFEGKVSEVRCDRNDVDAISRAMLEGEYDYVFDNVYDWERGTTAEQVEAAARASCRGLRRYVFMSSIAAYSQGVDHDEDDQLADPDCEDSYARNKAETERLLLDLHKTAGCPTVTLRPPFIYGPENPFYREQFFWDRLLADRPIVVPEDGERLMQLVLVDDLADAAISASEKNAALGRAYNIANERTLTQNELVRTLAKVAGKKAQLVHVPRAKLQELGGNVFQPPLYFGQYYDLPAITGKIGRARAELGFTPTPLEEGLQRTFEWYCDQDRLMPDFSFDDQVLEVVGQRV